MAQMDSMTTPTNISTPFPQSSKRLPPSELVFSIPELAGCVLDFLGSRSLCMMRLVSQSFNRACISHFRIALEHAGSMELVKTSVEPPREDIFRSFCIQTAGHLVKTLALFNCHPRNRQEAQGLEEWFSHLTGLESFQFSEYSGGSPIPDTSVTIFPWLRLFINLKSLRLRLSEFTRDHGLERLLLGLGSSPPASFRSSERPVAACPGLETLSIEIRDSDNGPGAYLPWEVLMRTLDKLPRLSSLSIQGFTVLPPEKIVDKDTYLANEAAKRNTRFSDVDDDGHYEAEGVEGEEEGGLEELVLHRDFPKIKHFQTFDCKLPRFKLAQLFPNLKSLSVSGLNPKLYTGSLPPSAATAEIPTLPTSTAAYVGIADRGATRPLELDQLSIFALSAENTSLIVDAFRPYRCPAPNSVPSGFTLKSVSLTIQVQTLNMVDFELFSKALQERRVEISLFSFSKGLTDRQTSSMLLLPCFKHLKVLDVNDLGIGFGPWQLDLSRPERRERTGYNALHVDAFNDGEGAILATIDSTRILEHIPFASTLTTLHLGAGNLGGGRFSQRLRSGYRFIGTPPVQGGWSYPAAIVILRRILATLPLLEEFSLGTALDNLSLFEGLGRCDLLERTVIWSERRDLLSLSAKANHDRKDPVRRDQDENEWIKNERPFLRTLRIYSGTREPRIATWQKYLEYRFRFLETLTITPDI